MVELDSQAAILRIKKRRGKGTLRRLDFSEAHSVRLTVTQKASRSVHGLFVVISIHKNYDMVFYINSFNVFFRFYVLKMKNGCNFVVHWEIV